MILSIRDCNGNGNVRKFGMAMIFKAILDFLMMKNIILVNFILFTGFFPQAQVGINTETPQATLDVTGKPTDNTVLDGIIPPRLTGAQLRAKTYTATQTGAMVYVTAADTSPAGQTIDVTSTGYFYFNGTKWIAAGSGFGAEQDGIIGNEVTAATTNGGLERAGSGTAVSPYTLGLTSGTTIGDLMTWNGTQWLPSAAVNIYNTNGSLIGARALTLNGFQLSFLGSQQRTYWSPQGVLFQSGTSTNKNANIALIALDNNSNGITSRLDFAIYPEQPAYIYAGEESTALEIGSDQTTNPTPIIFTTSMGGNAFGSEKIRITAPGSMGINTQVPTEKLDLAGIARIRNLPANGAANAINTTSTGGASASQNQTFTATKTVVADANGVLGYVDGPPFYQNIRGNVKTITGGYSIDATDYLIVTNVASGGSTITFPNLTAADAGRTILVFNNNSSGAANTLVGTTTILGQVGNNALRGRTLVWTGSVWTSIGL